jgi:hypothetical protein
MMNATPRFGFSAVRRAARSALQWRLLVLWTGCLLLPTAIMALPVWQVLGASLDHSVHAASLAQELDLTAIADLTASHGRNAAALGSAGIVALVLTLLLSPLLSGMVVSAARAGQVLGFGGLMSGAVQEYPRMFRMLLLAVVPFGIAAGLGAVAIKAAGKYGEAAILGSDAETAGRLALLVLGLLLIVAHASVDAGRAALATDRRRRSALVAWRDGCKMLARRPLATLGVYIGVSMVGLLLAALLGVARINLPHVSVVGFIAALLLTQLMVLVLAWMRSARLFALVDLAGSLRA